MSKHDIADLEHLLERISAAAHVQRQVTLHAVREQLGRRTFGPMLLLAGLITLAPLIGDIPGVPTLMGLFVLLVAGQLLLGRRNLWLPGWLTRRSLEREKVEKAVRWLKPPARFLDRLIHPRLVILVQGPGTYAIALTCLIIAIAMPVMEFIPFSANLAGLALSAFGLALIAKDGVLAAIAFISTLSVLWIIVNTIL